jgi:hypothetical protein
MSLAKQQPTPAPGSLPLPVRDFSWDCSSEIDSTRRVLYTADAYARDGRRFTVLANERLTAFWNYTRRFIVNLNSDEVLGDHR